MHAHRRSILPCTSGAQLAYPTCTWYYHRVLCMYVRPCSYCVLSLSLLILLNLVQVHVLVHTYVVCIQISRMKICTRAGRYRSEEEEADILQSGMQFEMWSHKTFWCLVHGHNGVCSKIRPYFFLSFLPLPLSNSICPIFCHKHAYDMYASVV